MNEQVPLYLRHCQQMQQQKLVAACHKDSFLQMAWNWLSFWKIVWAKLYHDYSKKSLSGMFRSGQRFSISEHLRPLKIGDHWSGPWIPDPWHLFIDKWKIMNSIHYFQIGFPNFSSRDTNRMNSIVLISIPFQASVFPDHIKIYTGIKIFFIEVHWNKVCSELRCL